MKIFKILLGKISNIKYLPLRPVASGGGGGLGPFFGGSIHPFPQGGQIIPGHYS